MKMAAFVCCMLCAASSLAVQVLWVGVDGMAKIHRGTTSYSWEEFAEYTGQDRADIGARITINGVAMPVGYEDPSGYIPPGQTAPTVFFDDPEWGISYEFVIWMIDSNDNAIPGDYSNWQPIRLDNTDQNAQVSYEIGYWTEDDFVVIASSEPVTLASIWDLHTYPSGSIIPSDSTSWCPTDYYIPVPEPEPVVLYTIGVGLFLVW